MSEITWRGMDEFRQALKNAPVEMMDDADAAASDAADGLTENVRAQYARVSKRFLRKGVRKKKLQKAAYRVGVSGQHVIYEIGTGQRHTKAGAARGQMPAKGPIFIPSAKRWEQVFTGKCQAIAQKSRGPRSTTSSLL